MYSEWSRTTKLYDGGYDLINGCYSENWLYNTKGQWVLSSGMYHSSSETQCVKKSMNHTTASADLTYSPVMALRSDVVVTGSGTQSEPYVMQ